MNEKCPARVVVHDVPGLELASHLSRLFCMGRNLVADSIDVVAEACGNAP
ncbi:MAG TPA: hypothetical protein VI953_02865 [Candidatus Paceibacterota bacterium]